MAIMTTSSIVQNHNGREPRWVWMTIDLVIKELKHLWPECFHVWGSPRHSECNGSVEWVNQTIQKSLVCGYKTTTPQTGLSVARWFSGSTTHKFTRHWKLVATIWHLVSMLVLDYQIFQWSYWSLQIFQGKQNCRMVTCRCRQEWSMTKSVTFTPSAGTFSLH